MIFLILQTVLGKQFTNISTHQLYNKLQQSQPMDVVVNQEFKIRDYPDAKYVIDSKIESSDKGNICYTKQGKVVFGDYEEFSQKVFDVWNSSPDPEYYLNIPVLLNMVHIKHAFAMVTSDHQILIYKITKNESSVVGHQIQLTTNYTFDFLREGALSVETPQMIYADYNQYIYIIYKDQVIGGFVDYDNLNKFTLRNITGQGMQNDKDFIGTVKSYGWQLYIPMGGDGLDIYQYQVNGDLQQIGNIDSLALYNKKKPINIVDVTFGNNENQTFMYVLDSLHGVSRFKINSNSTGVTTELDVDLGLILFQYGYIIEEYNDQYILILCQRDVIEYLLEIALHGNDWFKVKVHYLTGHYSEIDITPEFALLKGKDEHRIIRTGIYEKFEPQFIFSRSDNFQIEKQNSFYEDYVFVPHLLAIDFYNIQKGTTNKSVNYNLTNSFLVGITSQSIVYLPYIIENPYVICHPYASSQIGKTIEYTLKLNATHCPQKDTMIKMNIPSQLILCQFEDVFSITVTNGDGKMYDTEALASIVMGFIVLLILLSILLAYLYTRYKMKKDTFIDDIKGFGDGANKSGYDLDPQQDVSGL